MVCSNFAMDSLEENQEVPYLRYVLVSLFYVPCTFITLVGNMFVLISYRRDQRIRENASNAYFLNLALADLLVGVVMVIHTPVYFTGEWMFGELSCMAIWVLKFVATDMSAITIVAISVDRYLMVSNSLRHRSRQSHKKVGIVCCVLWLVCLAVHSTLAFTYSAKTGYVHENIISGLCDLGYRENLVVLNMLFMMEFLFPVVCVLSLNLIVCFRLKRRTKNLQARHQQRPCTTPSTTSITAEEEPSRRISCGDAGMRIHGNASGSQHKKAVKFLAVLLLVFVICWLPWYIAYCYTFLHSSGVHNDVIIQVVSFIVWMNSAINPFLYAFSNVFFKENFVHFLRCKRNLQSLPLEPKLQIISRSTN